MLRLKINLRVRRSVRVKCPRHPRYNPERDGLALAYRRHSKKPMTLNPQSNPQNTMTCTTWA